MTMTLQTLRPELPPLPWRIKHLPVQQGWPVPWFCVQIDGRYDFRVADGQKKIEAVKFKKCWVCGQPLGRFLAFPLGPMCAINRIDAEPPCHRECAEWSMQACPFLTQRQVRRRENDLPAEAGNPGGIMIKRQPGVVCLWIAKSYRVIRVEADGDVAGGILFKIGEPVEVKWYREGRQATRAEVLASIESGYPILLAAAEEDGPDAVSELEAARDRAMTLLPKE